MPSIAAQGAWRDALAPCEVFKPIKIAFRLPHATLKDLSASLQRHADVALVHVYAARHGLKLTRLFNRLDIALKFTLRAFKLRPQTGCLLSEPLRIFGPRVSARCCSRLRGFFS